jgi:serine/threonine-protein kinase
MGAVYMARRTGDADGRIVAVKRAHLYLADVGATLALEDEARLVGRIQDPHVVPVIEIERTDQGPLLVMPFVLGMSISEVMTAIGESAGTIPVSIAGRIALDALAGLAAAHEATGADGALLQIVHRDVTPQNLMVGADGVTRILDFGIAKAVGRLQKTTRDGALKGKLAYMAPEQIHGGEVGPHTDVYALGVVLWEMLAGTRLFHGDNEAHTMRQALVAEVPVLSARRDDVSVALDAVIAGSLSRTATGRFSSARVMATALELATVAASREEVAQWLRAVGSVELRDREARLASARIGPALTPVHGGPETRPDLTRPGPRPARRSWLVALLLLLLLGVGASALASFAPWGPPSARSSPSTTQTSASTVPSLSAPVSVAESISIPAPQASAVRAVLTSPSTRASSSPPRTPPRPSALPADCAVPYSIEEHGRKKFRAECLP